jgi:hypothetical protein
MDRLRLGRLDIAMAGGGGAAASPFLPTDAAGLLCWHDFSVIGNIFQDAAKTTPVTADGDDIGAVVDRSGNSRDAVQATAGNKPHYKVNIQNGLSMALSTVDSVLNTASIAHGIGTGDFLWVGVVRRTVQSSTADYAICTNGVYDPALFTRYSTDKASYYWGGYQNFTTVFSDNTTYLVEFRRVSGKIYLTINGVDDATVIDNTTSFANAVFTLMNETSGGGGGLVGYMGEWLFYKGYPAASIAAIRAYLNGKWKVFP